MSGNNIQTQSNGKKKLQSKVFLKRESLITELLKVKHFATIKHVFFSVLFGFIIRDLICISTNTKNADFGFTIIKTAFRNFHHAIIFWIILFILNISTYFAFKYWVKYRKDVLPKSRIVKLWDYFCVATLITYDVVLLTIVPLITVNHLNLGIASSATVLCENVRFIMKAHAFIRSNTPDVLHSKPHTDDEFILPPLSNFLYFSFAPTLVYRRDYPRTEAINVQGAATRFGEVLLIIWLKSYIFEIFFLKPYRYFGETELSWSNVSVIIMEGSLGGGVITMLDFYLLLHAWLNGFADLLRFADKRFYEDWWTSTNFSTYYRTWNVVVHDWLYEYVYKEFYQNITPNNKSVAKIMVFLLSAVIHEYIITFMINHFLPILFINFFLFGMAFTFLETKNPLYNIFLLYSLALGNSIHFSMHAMEYYARTNCPYNVGRNVSYFLPRFISLECS